MDLKSLRQNRMRERADAVSSGVEEKPIVVQPVLSAPSSAPQALNKIAQAIVQEHNKHEVQILTIEKYQWYGAELAKALAMHENRWMVDWIFEHGQQKNYAPFIVRPIRGVSEQTLGGTLVFRRPTVKPSSPRAKTLEWFIPWHHNVATPSFITYSSLPFQNAGYWYRLIDIDFGTGSEEDQMHNFCDHSEYKHFYDLLCSVNMVGVKMEKADVQGFQRLLQKASRNMKQTFKVSNLGCDPLFTGGGFRLLVKATDKEELGDAIDDWKANKLICPSSTIGYQAQKLFSIQTMKEHFQTEVDPHSKYFRFSNPAFSVIHYNDEMLDNLIAYYRTWQRSTYFDKRAQGTELTDREIYTMMVEEQKAIEEKIVNWGVLNAAW
jgi:hypothetical protein